MDRLPFILLPALIGLSALICISDWRQRRIPNKYLLAGLIYVPCVYLLLTMTEGGAFLLKGLGFSLLGLLLGGLLLYPGYRLRQLGAGDVKLGMVIGWFLGPAGAVISILTGALVGGVWALALSVRHGGVRQMLHNIRFMARSAYVSGFREMSWDLRSAGAVTMPYGVALCSGAVIVACWQLLIR